MQWPVLFWPLRVRAVGQTKVLTSDDWRQQWISQKFGQLSEPAASGDPKYDTNDANLPRLSQQKSTEVS